MTRGDYELVQGDAVSTLAGFADDVVDAVITDPPYPEIDRDYGRMTEVEWRAMMDALIVEVRRVLKPSGSAVFVLQPNAERNGRMRSWLWRFMADYADAWGLVQDVYWWNWGAMPLAGTRREIGLLRGSLKPCVWLGPPDCYRNQEAVLWEPSDSVKALTREGRAFRASGEASGGDRKQAFRVYDAPDGKTIDKSKIMASHVERGGVTPFNVIPLRDEHVSEGSKIRARGAEERMMTSHVERGGVTPFNVIPLGNTDSANSGGALGHPAATPAKLCAWWVRYIVPPGGVVVDPFSGSGTVALEAAKLGRHAVGIERDAGYHKMASDRLSAHFAPAVL